MSETQDDIIKEELQLYGDAQIAAVKSCVEAIPEAPEADALSIAAQVLKATSVESLDAPWKTEGLVSYEGIRLTVTGVRRLPSDFADGIGFYVIIDGVLTGTGEMVTFTTGSVSVVMQLGRAIQLDALPLAVIPRRAAKPSKAGYYPWHLEIDRSA